MQTLATALAILITHVGRRGADPDPDQDMKILEDVSAILSMATAEETETISAALNNMGSGQLARDLRLVADHS